MLNTTTIELASVMELVADTLRSCGYAVGSAQIVVGGPDAPPKVDLHIVAPGGFLAWCDYLGVERAQVRHRDDNTTLYATRDYSGLRWRLHGLYTRPATGPRLPGVTLPSGSDGWITLAELRVALINLWSQGQVS